MKTRKELETENEKLRQQVVLLESDVEELEELISIYDDYDEVKMLKTLASAISFTSLQVVAKHSKQEA